MQEILERAGLTKNEAKVYVVLIGLGLTTSKAVIEKTNLHRQIVYDALNRLVEKGLVSFVMQANRKYFRASEPGQFLDYLDSKKDEIEQQKQEFRRMIPQLEAKKKQYGEEQEATVYFGNKGIKSVLWDMLNEGKEILTIGASEIKAESYIYQIKFNIPKFHKLRREGSVPMKILLSEDMKGRAKALNKQKYTESRTLPKEFTSNSSTNIYGNKVSIIMWGSQPFGILIKSMDIAESQRKYFRILWKMAKSPGKKV